MSNFSDSDDVEEGAVANSVHQSSMQPSIHRASKIGFSTSKTQEFKDDLVQDILQPQPHHIQIKKARKQKKFGSYSRKQKNISQIPLLNKDTVNPMTYDLDSLLNPKTQKLSKPRNRIKDCHTQSLVSTPTQWKKDIGANTASTPKNLNSCKQLYPHMFFSFNQVKSKPENVDVEERFYKHMRETLQKVQDWKRQQEEDELASCSFRPSINRTINSKSKRSIDQFYKDMMNHQRVHQDKIKVLREQKEKTDQNKEHFKFKPTLCSKSVKILATKTYSQIPSHERLYQMYRVNSQHDYYLNHLNGEEISREGDQMAEEVPSFTPAVNKKSKQLVRNKPIQTVLYQDALRRMSKTHQTEKVAKYQTSKNSINILVGRFLKEFDRNIKEMDIGNTGKLNYTKFNQIFINMHFLHKVNKKNNREIVLILDIWMAYHQKEFMEISDLKVIMMAIMGYHKSWMNDPNSQNLILNERQTKKFHQKFKLLFENRGAFLLGNSLAKPTEQIPKKKVKKKRNKFAVCPIKLEDFLIKQGELTNQKLELLRKKQEAEQINQYSFSPNKNPKIKISTVEIKEQTDMVKQEFKKLLAFRSGSINILDFSIGKISHQTSRMEESDEPSTPRSFLDVFSTHKRHSFSDSKISIFGQKRSVFDQIKETNQSLEEPDAISEQAPVVEEPPKTMSWMSLFKKPQVDQENKPEENEMEISMISQNPIEYQEKKSEEKQQSEDNKTQAQNANKKSGKSNNRSRFMTEFAKKYIFRSSTFK